jgi:hypothetical protein
MQNDPPREFMTPVVTELLPSSPATPPPSQRELVEASLLARPSSSSTTKA